MANKMRVLALFIVFMLAFFSTAQADYYAYTTLNVPGAYITQAYGINNSGQVSGTYYDTNGQHGFIKSGSTFNTFDAPGANVTYAYGINNSGQVVGYYSDSNGYHGYLKTGDVFTPVDVPGDIQTRPWGINNLGQIVGTSVVSGRPDYGFVISGGNLITFAVPGAMNTEAYGINDSGQVVGTFTNETGNHGFIKTGDNFTFFDVPGLSTASGINNSGQIVGTYLDVENSRWQMFIKTEDSLSSFYFPGAGDTIAWGINDSGLVVGEARFGGERDVGFLASPSPYPPPNVPLPSAVLLLGSGLVRLAAYRRRLKKGNPI